jgi:hypothetical protein
LVLGSSPGKKLVQKKLVPKKRELGQMKLERTTLRVQNLQAPVQRMQARSLLGLLQRKRGQLSLQAPMKLQVEQTTQAVQMMQEPTRLLAVLTMREQMTLRGVPTTQAVHS